MLLRRIRRVLLDHARRTRSGHERRRPAAEGYSLVVLVVLITVLSVAVATALPLWTQAIQRDKEEELIFRGMQYAEAIRVFQRRVGRAPINLDELLKVEPRSIRQLYPNPMREDGAWGLLVQAGAGAAAAQGRGSNRGQQPVQPQQSPSTSRTGGQPGGIGIRNETSRLTAEGQRRDLARGGGALVAVPPVGGAGGQPQRRGGNIQGVYAAVEGESIKTWNGQQTYDAWHFTAGMIPVPQIRGSETPVPRINSTFLFRPFRQGVEPPGQATPGSGQAAGDATRPQGRRPSNGRLQRRR